MTNVLVCEHFNTTIETYVWNIVHMSRITKDNIYYSIYRSCIIL